MLVVSTDFLERQHRIPRVLFRVRSSTVILTRPTSHYKLNFYPHAIITICIYCICIIYIDREYCDIL